MAYSVQQRTQEIGIRLALGADRPTIRRLVIWNGMRLALIGVVIGVAASFGLTRLMASFLFGVKTWDPTAFIAVPVVLSFVALIAVWLPAIRASRSGTDAGAKGRVKLRNVREIFPGNAKCPIHSTSFVEWVGKHEASGHNFSRAARAL